jgi:CheY-like chemotaxis protein/anti-sigma regulatory factor (Ser/Thr protein kinase)
MKAKAPRILVVDDDRATRHVARAALMKAGFTVRVAQDGVEALARLRASTFDLMLLDVWMPRMDGLAVLDRLKRMKIRPRVVVMTSDDAPETLLRAIRQQAQQYVHKPIAPAALLSLVRDALARGVETPIEVVSARSNWVELVVPCTRENAERVHGIMAQLETDLPEEVRESVGYAFRELLLNAVEWGGKLDPTRKVRIAYLRAKRMLMYRIVDPGPGFKLEGLEHAAISHPDDPIEHMRVREEKGIRPGGFGILVVRAKVDELIYNEKQNEVVFVKYLD